MGGRLKGNIVGVLKDFHNRSFRAPLCSFVDDHREKLV